MKYCACGEPIKYSGPTSECEDCETIRRDPDPSSEPTYPDPLAGQRRALVVLLTELDVPDPLTITGQVLQQMSIDLPGLLKARALQAAGLVGRKLKANNNSGATGVGWHRGKWRARCWRGGKVVFNFSSVNKERAIQQRAKYLADHP